ncbi:DEAD/DEAH box helicase family protein [Bacillus cereus group sp. TH217LC]|uniref:DEAD/DEAH box helicase n=1 Tax=Bacillus cereus group TaxID=86661 RepID=UPI0009437559|nr:DEAD/DEAH box helicase family protein [Bacillus cereus group sp. TH217LC]MDA1598132.1 DEAD/DEAH box helicase family protein [Bacillus cereus group sp. TH217LC]
MELKDYQLNAIKTVENYLNILRTEDEELQELKEVKPKIASKINVPNETWDKLELKKYNNKVNGLGENVPNVCLKVPTGGGKTLLATYSIDLVNTHYLRKQTGFVLWIVPSSQIYNQTLEALKDRNHPYRQKLDISSGGRTLIVEKSDRFTPQDVNENLVVMVLMLQSSNRKTKETLKMFQDSGGYVEFFPPEDNVYEHKQLIDEYPNLDVFEEIHSLFPTRQVKTSLGNVLRVLQPIVIIDEGHKAYSTGAQKTILDFNPKIILELSATPKKESNILVSVSGLDLDREEMIKLDLNIINKSSGDWKDTVLTTVEKRNQLESQANDYRKTTGKYIRPISLIQVERTGKNQQDGNHIHSEDVKEFLIKQCNISPDEIAIKSSEKDDIEGIDLLSEDSSIRYIITKQALQEGWDCPFAYTLTILSKSSSETGLTQLVGRILRQPYAKKTGIQELDESYVYCYQQESSKILESIRKGLKIEGMGDLTNRVTGLSENNDDSTDEVKQKIKMRDKFKQLKGKIFLPKFLYEQENRGWRPVSYEIDILSRIDWKDICLDGIKELKLSVTEKTKDEVFRVGITDGSDLVNRYGYQEEVYSESEIDISLMTRQITDIVPNMWIAFEICKNVVDILNSSYDKNIINANLSYVLEELKKLLEKEKNRLAQIIFYELIDSKRIQFILEERKVSIPNLEYKVGKNEKRLVRTNGDPIEKSLVEPVVESDFNPLEKSFALCLDTHEKLLWWYRNIERVDYSIQGWRKQKIYPDFIFSDVKLKENNDFSTVYVMETKGKHLMGNDDTTYKEDIFKLCNDLGKKTSWNALGLEFQDQKFVFHLVSQEEWKKSLYNLLD